MAQEVRDNTRNANTFKTVAKNLDQFCRQIKFNKDLHMTFHLTTPHS